MNANLQADWCCPPGKTIQDALLARSIDIDNFAAAIERSVDDVERLIRGDLRIDWELSVALADQIGASPRFWQQRESDYLNDLHALSLTALDASKEWLKSFPVSELVRLGWIPSTRSAGDRLKNCLDFFGVSSKAEWEDRYTDLLDAVAFRSSKAFESDPKATIAWLRKGEQLAQDIQCLPWNRNRFEDSLSEIRSLTLIKEPTEFVPKLQRIAADAGVAVVVVPAPKGCKASGVTRFLSLHKALMMLSFRHKTDDHFWFTFFHEAAHLILHSNSELFLENGGTAHGREEDEANTFAQDLLVPPQQRAHFHELGADYRKIMRFARRIGVSAGIVLGQMQHFGLIDRSRLNRLKRRYLWEIYQ